MRLWTRVFLYSLFIALSALTLSAYFLANDKPQSLNVLHTGKKIPEEISLTKVTAETFSSNDWLGKWSLLAIGYTHCPDICPMILGTYREILSKLTANELATLQVLFFSVDQEHDNLEVLKEFLGNFDTRIIGLIGSDVQENLLTSAIAAYVSQDDKTIITHSEFIYLINPKGEWMAYSKQPYNAAGLINGLRQIWANQHGFIGRLAHATYNILNPILF